MVLLSSCSTSSLLSAEAPASYTPDFYQDLIGCTPTQPIPFRSSFYSTCDDSSSAISVERLSSPLSTSAESISSIKSSCSSRSSVEREMERAQRRQLLDLSLVKIRGNGSLPLRKHLLVFNTIKQLQRDLDQLDDEELYCNLLGITGCESSANDGARDEHRWMASATSHGNGRGGVAIPPPLAATTTSSKTTPSTATTDVVMRSEIKCNGTNNDTATTAPLMREERHADAFIKYNDDAFEMDDIDGNNEEANNMNDYDATSNFSSRTSTTKTWSWSCPEDGNLGLFNNIEKESPLTSSWPSQRALSMWACGDDSNGAGLYSWTHSGFDLWGSADLNQSADPMAGGKFDFQHLFPSEVLLQA